MVVIYKSECVRLCLKHQEGRGLKKKAPRPPPNKFVKREMVDTSGDIHTSKGVHGLFVPLLSQPVSIPADVEYRSQGERLGR